MKIAICDDEVFYRERVLELTKAYASQNKNKDISITVFSHSEELLESVFKNGEFDIYILDIVMPGMNGIELGKELRDNGYEGKIIYLTSSEEYAVDSYMVRAFNYILKPFPEDAFLCALDATVMSISDRIDKFIIVRTKESSVRIKFDSIMYAELVRRNVIYHLTNGKTVESVSVRTSFADTIQELLKDRRFILCGASMVANMHHITEVENKALIFNDTYKAYLGIKACRDVRAGWLDFCFSEVEGK